MTYDPPPAGRRVALVIGNGAYAVATPLEAPRDDAAAMAHLLDGLGFEVLLGLDCDYADFRARLRDFADRIKAADLALFYFSGHGVAELGAANHLLPVDADIRETDDLGRVTIPLTRVLDRMNAPGLVSLIFLDACHNDPFITVETGVATKGVLAEQPGLRALARDDLPEALIGFAADEGRTADDGPEGGLSPFTAALVQHLATPGLEVRDVMRAVSRAVRDATDGRQQPWYKDKLVSDVVLVPLPGQQVAPPVPDRPDVIPRPPPPVRPARTRLLLAAVTAVFAALAGLGAMLGRDPLCDRLHLFCPQGMWSEGDTLAARVPLLDAASETVRKATFADILAAFGEQPLSPEDQDVVLTALLDLIAPDTLTAMSANGRFNTISVLSQIPPEIWQDPAALALLDAAQQAVGALDAAVLDRDLILGARTNSFLGRFRHNIAYVPRNEVVIYFQYLGFDPAQVRAVAEGLHKGWNWPQPDPSPVDRADLGRPGDVREVRYPPGDLPMQVAATLIAAQLNGQIPPAPAGARAAAAMPAFGRGGLPAITTIAEASIAPNHLEIWISR